MSDKLILEQMLEKLDSMYQAVDEMRHILWEEMDKAKSKQNIVKEDNVYISDVGFFEKTFEKYSKDCNINLSFEDVVGLKLLFKFLGPNDFAARGVYEIVNKRKFVSFAVQMNVNFTYTKVSSHEEYLASINDPLASVNN